MRAEGRLDYGAAIGGPTELPSGLDNRGRGERGRVAYSPASLQKGRTVISILNECFLKMRSELDFWLRVFVALARAVPVCILAGLRERFGVYLLDLALRVLPGRCPARETLLLHVREQREYDRYWAFARIVGDDPLPFERWRQQSHWIHTKARALA